MNRQDKSALRPYLAQTSYLARPSSIYIWLDTILIYVTFMSLLQIWSKCLLSRASLIDSFYKLICNTAHNKIHACYKILFLVKIGNSFSFDLLMKSSLMLFCKIKQTVTYTKSVINTRNRSFISKRLFNERYIGFCIATFCILLHHTDDNFT